MATENPALEMLRRNRERDMHNAECRIAAEIMRQIRGITRDIALRMASEIAERDLSRRYP